MQTHRKASRHVERLDSDGQVGRQTGRQAGSLHYLLESRQPMVQEKDCQEEGVEQTEGGQQAGEC